jgi:spore coat polysaccharide biosynthesis predicted glycosyltransferase SpsG
MRHNVVSIITGWGQHLGAGHIQRMASLTYFLNRKKKVRTFIINHKRPEFLPSSIYKYVSPEIGPHTTCIIRDIRDSTINDMRDLKNNYRVIAVDDCGPGRNIADLAIDLLPNLTYTIHKRELFIYGYNFADSIRRLNRKNIAKTIDCTIYCGFNPSRETVDFFLSLIPSRSTCVILSGKNSLLYKDGELSPLFKSHAEILLSSIMLISHFGVTLYEGHIAGCRLLSINPTEYHSQLADRAKKDIGITNLGVSGSIDPDNARTSISTAIKNPVTDKINSATVLEKIENGLEEFYLKIQPFLDD